MENSRVRAAGGKRPAGLAGAFVGLVATLGLLAPPAGAEPAPGGIDYGLEVAIASDYLDRGVSQTQGRPALQLGLSATAANGLYAWLWSSNIDYTASGLPDDGAGVEVDAGIGYWRQLTDGLAVDVSVTRYMMPGTVEGVRYDYNELCVTLGIAESASLSVSVSDSIHNTGASAWHVFAGGERAVAWDTVLDAGVGWFDLEAAYGAAYAYVRVGAARDFGPLTARLEYDVTTDAAIDIFGTAAAGGRVVVSLAAAFE